MRTVMVAIALIAAIGCGDSATSDNTGGVGGDGGAGGNGGAGGDEGNFLERTLVECDKLWEHTNEGDGHYFWDLSAEFEVETGDAVVMTLCGYFNTFNGERVSYDPECVTFSGIVQEDREPENQIFYCEQGSVDPWDDSRTSGWEAIYFEINTEYARQIAEES